MSKGPLIFWLVIELWRLCLTPTAAEIVVTGFLDQSVTLPCMYSSWSPNSNSMCWGRGPCPKSKCNDMLLFAEGKKVVSRKSAKYDLLGNIQRGDVSLTIYNTKPGDSSVYCCRIEVPGWFNDVKINIRLELRAPTTTTRRPTTTTTTTTTTTSAAVATAITVLPTTAVTTPDPTTRAPLQIRTTNALTTTATMCPLTTAGFLPEEDTIPLTHEPPTERPFLTAESETVLSKTSQRSTEVTSTDTASLISKETRDWILQSTSQTSMWGERDSVTSQTRASETTILLQNEVESEQIKMVKKYDLLMIIAPSLGFVLLVLLLAFFLRGKVLKTSCFQKHTRLDNEGEGKNVFNGREDEDGLFTL
uniref:Ig-like domain-containing protein n=1 Tax=Sus scrofa TaxID=9823 RepID=A0A8D0RJ25_PIG